MALAADQFRSIHPPSTDMAILLIIEPIAAAAASVSFPLLQFCLLSFSFSSFSAGRSITGTGRLL